METKLWYDFVYNGCPEASGIPETERFPLALNRQLAEQRLAGCERSTGAFRMLMTCKVDWLGRNLRRGMLIRALKLIQKTPEIDWFMLVPGRPSLQLDWALRICSESITVGELDDANPDDCLLHDVAMGRKPLPNLWLGMKLGVSPRESIGEFLTVPVARRLLIIDELKGYPDIARTKWTLPHGIDWVITSGGNYKEVGHVQKICRVSDVPYFCASWTPDPGLSESKLNAIRSISQFPTEIPLRRINRFSRITPRSHMNEKISQ